MTDYQDINEQAITRWIEEGWEWGKPISHEEFESVKNGAWTLFLTPTKKVPRAWLPSNLKGLKVLGLAAGGGQQMPHMAACGCVCTCLDYTKKQLDTEAFVAKREGYLINLVKADMTKQLPFDDESFDIIIHPVSNNYVEQVEPIFKECYRVLKKGGILICGLDNGINYLFDEEEEKIINKLPFNPFKNEDQMKQLVDQDCAIQFSHTMEEQIGGQLKAGFRLTDIFEDTNGEGRLHEFNVPSFISTRSIKE